jgi:hypothetical protein
MPSLPLADLSEAAQRRLQRSALPIAAAAGRTGLAVAGGPSQVQGLPPISSVDLAGLRTRPPLAPSPSSSSDLGLLTREPSQMSELRPLRQMRAGSIHRLPGDSPWPGEPATLDARSENARSVFGDAEPQDTDLFVFSETLVHGAAKSPSRRGLVESPMSLLPADGHGLRRVGRPQSMVFSIASAASPDRLALPPPPSLGTVGRSSSLVALGTNELTVTMSGHVLTYGEAGNPSALEPHTRSTGGVGKVAAEAAAAAAPVVGRRSRVSRRLLDSV